MLVQHDQPQVMLLVSCYVIVQKCQQLVTRSRTVHPQCCLCEASAFGKGCCNCVTFPILKQLILPKENCRLPSRGKNKTLSSNGWISFNFTQLAFVMFLQWHCLQWQVGVEHFCNRMETELIFCFFQLRLLVIIGSIYVISFMILSRYLSWCLRVGE